MSIQADLRLSYVTRESLLSDPERGTQEAAKRGVDISDRFVLYDSVRISRLLDDYEFSIDLIGADIQRGIIRANYRGLTPSVFNVATWHNKGIQDVQTLLKSEDGPAAIGYGVLVTKTLVDDVARYLSVPSPQNSIRYDDTPGENDESRFFK